MPITTTDLDEIAHQLGVTVTEHDGGEKGRHYPGGVISLRRGLGWVARRCTLAHELGHAAHGDVPTTDPWVHARQERRADEFAARVLVTPEAMAAAEAEHGPHDGALALELGITTHLVGICRTIHERTFTP